MPSHEKAGKIVTKTKFESQDYVDYLTAFHVLVRAAEHGNATAARSLATMNIFAARILALPNSPGIRCVITQSELKAAVAENRAYKDGHLPASVIRRNRIRNARLKAGWTVEPGILGIKMDGPRFIIYFRDQPRAARPADPQTPSAETLQAWFDLPSEPRQAEGSLSES